MKSFLLNLGLALDAVFVNKLRAILTALGILFGVAAVIAMLAIGNGAKRSILDQMRLIGTNNIVIKSLNASAPSDGDKSDNANSAEQSPSSPSGEKKKRPWSPGLAQVSVITLTASALSFPPR